MPRPDLAPNPGQAPNDATGGLDWEWEWDENAVSIVNVRGREIALDTVEHPTAGRREPIPS